MASLSWSDRTRLAKKNPSRVPTGAVDARPGQKRTAALLLMALAASSVLLFASLMNTETGDLSVSPTVAAVLAIMIGTVSSIMLFLRYIATRSASRAGLVISFTLTTLMGACVFAILPMLSFANHDVDIATSAYTVRLFFVILLIFALRIEIGARTSVHSQLVWVTSIGILLMSVMMTALSMLHFPDHLQIAFLQHPEELLMLMCAATSALYLLRRNALHDEFLTMLVMLLELMMMGSVFIMLSPNDMHAMAYTGYAFTLFALLLPTFYLQMGMFTTYRYSEQYRLKGREMAISVSAGQELSPIVFREIAKQLTDPLAITDIEGRILFANKALSELSGLDSKKLIGSVASQWQHASIPQDFYPKMFKMVREKRETVEATVKNAVSMNPKKSYDASVRITPVLDEFGEIACTILTQHNLSAEQERANTLRQILNTIPLGVMLLDAHDLHLSLVNVQAEYLLGRAGIDLSSLDSFSVLASHMMTQDRKPYAEENLPPLVTQKTGKNAEAKDIALFTGNDPKPTMIWSMHTVPFLNTEGALQTILVSFEDIREHQEFDHKMTDFISVASHQLRTPLTGIKWSLDELRKKNDTMTSEDQRTIFETCFEASDRMMITLQQLLQVAELERGGVEKKAAEAIDIKQAIEDGVKGLQINMTKKKLTFKQSVLKSLPLLHADKFILMQMIGNILENAVKYTPDNGEIDSILTMKENRISWTLHDTGIGISKQDLPKVFDKFFRTDSAQKMVPDGTGLGLYIVKSIVERMGGTVTIESEEGRGTTVEVLLPIG